MSSLSRILSVLWTQARWGWKFRKLGGRSAFGRGRMASGAGVTELGRHVTMMDGWVLADLAPGEGPATKIHIGDWCTLMFDFQVNAAVSVRIGEGCLIASRVFIADSDHVLQPGVTMTSRSHEYASAPVVIENNCWLGQNVVVLKGAHIGHHSVVAANAVVNKSFPPYSIIGGVPARRIGEVPHEPGENE